MASEKSARKRILMMADANFLAHTSRLLEIGKVLERLGHEVIFAGDGQFMFLPQQEGMKTDWVYTVPGERTLELARQAGFVGYFWWKDTIYRSIRSDIECIERNSPDLVIGDMHWTLCASCAVTKVPYVSITNAHWTNYFAVALRAFDGHFTTRLFGERLAARVVPLLKKYLGAYWSLPYQRFKKENNLSRDYSNLFSLIEGDITLLADIPEFGPTANLPPTMSYVGPILWQPRLADPEWLDELDPTKPTLYFTMGSSGSPKFFEDAIDTFGHSNYQVIMTTGGLFDGSGRLPKNVFIAKYAPGLRLMEKSDIVINHGGNGTVYQAIAAGAPIIGIPTHLDQDINLQRVEDLGFGIKLRSRQSDARDLVRAVERILSDGSYRQNALKLQASFRRFNGPHMAAERIQQLLRIPSSVSDLKVQVSGSKN
jgi:MGT family glycosyltransferase